MVRWLIFMGQVTHFWWVMWLILDRKVVRAALTTLLARGR